MDRKALLKQIPKQNLKQIPEQMANHSLQMPGPRFQLIRKTRATSM